MSSKTETMKKILKERSARNKDKKNKKNSSKNATKNSKRSRSELESNDNVHSLAEKIKKETKASNFKFSRLGFIADKGEQMDTEIAVCFHIDANQFHITVFLLLFF